jgi:hypothetical protein
MKILAGLLGFMISMCPFCLLAYWAGRLAYDGKSGWGWFLLALVLLLGCSTIKWNVKE